MCLFDTVVAAKLHSNNKKNLFEQQLLFAFSNNIYITNASDTSCCFNWFFVALCMFSLCACHIINASYCLAAQVHTNSKNNCLNNDYGLHSIVVYI